MGKYFFRTLLGLLIFLWSSLVTLSQEIPFNRAITVIQSAENSLKSAEWKCNIRYKLRIPREMNLDNIDESKLVDSQTYADYSVLYDIQRKTYLVEGESRLQWYEGSHPRLTSLLGYSYDGKKYSSWRRSKGGDNLPDHKEYTEGRISMDMNQVEHVARFHDTNGACVEFGTGFPGQLTLQNEGYKSMPLSTALNEWKSKGFPVSIKELSQDKWLIEAKINFIPANAERDIKIHLIPKNGIVTFFSRGSQFRGKESVEYRMEVTTLENENKQVVPHTMRIVYPLDYLMDICIFSNVKINPPVKRENIQLSFPEGTIVEDFVLKKYYKVGDIINEDNAISDFMLQHNLTGDVPSSPHRHIVLRSILIISGLTLIIIALYLRFFKKRDK